MATIEISDEDLAFLRELSREIKTQNNCATASPYFFVVETEREIIVPLGHSGDRVYAVHDDETKLMRSIAEVQAYGAEHGIDPDELRGRTEEYDVMKVEDHHNVFFTRKGYETHMELNGHNYRGVSCKNARPYVKHAGRNPEIRQLLEIVHRIGGVP